MKRIIALLLLLCLLTGCSGTSLSGLYSDEYNNYSIQFEKDGSCTWYQDGLFFVGNYYKTDEGYQLDIMGSGLYSNTSFYATTKDEGLEIRGGVIGTRLFTKQ